MMSKLFDTLVLVCIAARCSALAKATDENLFCCYHSLSGALTPTLSQTGRIDQLSAGE